MRVGIKKPKSGEFVTTFASQSLAPGMAASVDLSFTPQRSEQFQDVLVVRTHGHDVSIPITVYAPQAALTWPKVLDFGHIPTRGEASVMLPLVNEGTVDASFALLPDAGLPLQATPAAGTVPAGGRIGVRLDLTALAPGVLRGLLSVEVNGRAAGVVDCQAAVSAQTLQVLSLDSRGRPGPPLSSVQFGAAYFGTRRTVRMLLVNSGPRPASFTALAAGSVPGSSTLGMGEGSPSARSLSDSEDGTPSSSAGSSIPVRAVPSEGVLRPNGQQEILLTFTPVDEAPRPAFAAQAAHATHLSATGQLQESKAAGGGAASDTSLPSVSALSAATTAKHAQPREPSQHFEGELAFVNSDTKQSLVLPLSATAVRPALVLSQSTCAFGPTALNKRKDILLQIKNDNPLLPVAWQVPRAAPFFMEPADGVLQPYEGITVVASFKPRVSGQHMKRLHLLAADVDAAAELTSLEGLPPPAKPASSTAAAIAAASSRAPPARLLQRLNVDCVGEVAAMTAADGLAARVPKPPRSANALPEEFVPQYNFSSTGKEDDPTQVVRALESRATERARLAGDGAAGGLQGRRGGAPAPLLASMEPAALVKGATAAARRKPVWERDPNLAARIATGQPSANASSGHGGEGQEPAVLLWNSIAQGHGDTALTADVLDYLPDDRQGYTQTLRQQQKLHAHKQQYNDYLVDARLNREQATVAALASSGGGKRRTAGDTARSGLGGSALMAASARLSSSAVASLQAAKEASALSKNREVSADVGNLAVYDDPKGALPEPTLRMPRATEGLWLQQPMTADGRPAGPSAAGGRNPKTNPLKLHSKKFKGAPSTQAEVRDCEARLEPDELRAVVANTHELNFGQLTVRSITKRNFAVTNGARSTIIVALRTPHTATELEGTTPLAQVIPPGATAGFDVCLAVEAEGDIAHSVSWSVNGHHTFRFLVAARVVPMELIMSKPSLYFRFPEMSANAELTQEVKLTNPGNAAAHYSWATQPNTPYSFSPPGGTLGPGQSTPVAVTYTPRAGAVLAATASLQVDGAAANEPAATLDLNAEAEDIVLVPSEPEANFGTVSVGIAARSSLLLRNTGTSAAFLRISRPNQWVDVHPASARIVPGDELEIVVTLQSSKPMSLPDHSHLVIMARGAEDLRVPMAGSVVMPAVEVEEEGDVDFGAITTGGQLRRRLTLVNRGVIPTEVTCDLSDFPQFTAAPPRSMFPLGGAGGDDSYSVSAESAFASESVSGSSEAGADAAFSDEPASGEGGAASPRAAEGDGDADGEPEVPRKFTLKVGAGKRVAFDLVFKPTVPRAHQFAVPFTVAGVPLSALPKLLKTVHAVGMEPRLQVSASFVDFQHKVVPSSSGRRLPYTALLAFTNLDVTPLQWDIDSQQLEQGGDVFSVEPFSGLLAPEESCEVRVHFSPAAPREYSVMLPLYLDGTLRQARLRASILSSIAASGLIGEAAEVAAATDLAAAGLPTSGGEASGERPYLELEARGLGILPQLSFSQPTVELPIVPTGVPSHATFRVVNTGFDHLKLEYEVGDPSKPSLAPVKLLFPEGRTLSLAKESIPVVVVVLSHKPVSFTVLATFKDSKGGKYAIPITAVVDNSLLTTYPYVESCKENHSLLVRPAAAPQLLSNAAISLQLAKDASDAKRAGHAAGRGARGGAGRPNIIKQPSISDLDGTGSKLDDVSRSPAQVALEGSSILSVDGPHTAVGGQGRGVGGLADASVLGGKSVVARVEALLKASSIGKDKAATGKRAGHTQDARKRVAVEQELLAVQDEFTEGPAAAALIAQLPEAPPQRPLSSQSAAFLVHWLNTCCLRTPIASFPADIVALNGKPVWDMLESLSSKALPWRLSGKLPAGSRERTQVLLTQARQALAFLKAHAALVHHVRPEALLPKKDFVRVRSAPAGMFGPVFGGPVLKHSSAATRIAERNAAGKAFYAESLAAWATVVLQVIRVFSLSGISLKTLLNTPGMTADSAVQSALTDVAQAQVEANQADSAGDGRNDPSSSGALAALGRAKKRAFAPDRLLTPSNFLSISEGLLARWLQYHHNRVFHEAPRRVVDFARDLKDGVVLAGVILSHAPQLKLEDGPLHNFNRQPMGNSELRGNMQCVVNALQALHLTPPFTPQDLTREGVEPGDGDGLDAAALQEVRAAAAGLPVKRQSAKGAEAVHRAMFATHGALVHSTSPVVTLGEGCQRDSLLAALWLFQSLPSLIPRAAVTFACALGRSTSKSIELTNPADVPVTYHVFLAGSEEFTLPARRLRLEAGGRASFEVRCTPTLSRPAHGRLTFQPLREAGAGQGSVMVFSLHAVVTSRPPIAVVSAETDVYKAVTVNVPVQNLLTATASFRVALVHLPLGADSGANIPKEAIDKARESVRAAATAALQDGPAGHEAPPGSRGSRSARSLGSHRGSKPNTPVAAAGPMSPADAGFGTGADPDAWMRPFFCRTEEVTLKARAQRSLSVQFFPLMPGPHKVAIVLTDPAQGELVWEVHGVAGLPAVSHRMSMEAQLAEVLDRAVALPLMNRQMDVAHRTLLERLDRRRRGPETKRWDDARAAGALSLAMYRAHRAGRAPPPGGPVLYEVEVDSPYVEVPPTVELSLAGNPHLVSSDAQGGGRAGGGEDSRPGSTTGGASKASLVTMADVQSMETAAAAASATGRATAPLNLLPLLLRPQGSGEYSCTLLLRSDWDVRLLKLSANVTPPNVTRELKLTTTPGHPVVQEVPIVNNTGSDWHFTPAFAVAAMQEDVGDFTRVPAALQGGGGNTHSSSEVSEGKGSPRMSGGAPGKRGHHFTFPAVITVKARTRGVLALTYAPQWSGEEAGTLVLTNSSVTSQEISLQLQGVCKEPLAEDHIELDLPARGSRTLKLRVPNRSTAACKLAVHCDLPFVVPQEATVAAAAGTAPPSMGHNGAAGIGPVSPAYATVHLDVAPVASGPFAGIITFTDVETGRFVWYSMRITVAPPEPEGVLHISAVAQEGATVEVPLRNPRDQPVDFEVVLSGAHLTGPDHFHLEGGQSGLYRAEYNPLAPGSSSGTLAFLSDATGEVWYEVQLEALPPQDTRLPLLSVPVGLTGQHEVQVHNPGSSPATVQLQSDNTRLVTVSPASVVVPAGGAATVLVEYTPCSVGQTEQAVVTAMGTGLGSWRYVVQGQGTPPGVHPTDTVITAPAGASASSSVPFRNPFPEPLHVVLALRSGKPRELPQGVAAAGGDAALSPTNMSGSVSMRSAAHQSAAPSARARLAAGTAAIGANADGSLPDDDALGTFKLLRKQRATVPPLSFLQVPLAYEPSVISESFATLLVKAPEQRLAWQFPLKGVGETVGHKRPFVFSARARQRVVSEVELPLTGLPPTAVGEPFHLRVEPLQECDAKWLSNAVRVQCLNPGNTVHSVQEPLRLRVEMEALKPSKVPARILVAKASGGQWAFDAVFEAAAPEPDDFIVIEAALNKMASIAFALNNQLPSATPFRAYFTLDSSPEFGVSPSSGELPPPGQPGAQFTVTFAPTEYGKPCRGRLVVDTPDMQWTYELAGQPPAYIAPRALHSKVDTQLKGSAASALHASLTSRGRGGGSKDFMRSNMKVTSSMRSRGAAASNAFRM